ncbi:MAG: enoyl-CoA hydratase/isomerase family protein [Chloroflexi bacterium]|nr:enoyl-CoA hydratase/isomerase family protein [Chloroflexota bacterium]
MTYRDLLYDVSDSIATITLNRPERLNAISGGMLASFSDAFREADHDRGVRVIILTGAGKGFCSGLDLKEQGANANDNSINGAGGLPAKFDIANSPPVVLHQTDKPVICALNGAAAGYGLDLALGCDIRIAADTAKLAAVFTKRGVLPESGGTWLLPRLIGWSKAAELAFTGRTLSAQQSLELGLVSSVVPAAELTEASRALAAEIAANAPMAVQATKRMMRLSLDETFEANVHHVYLQLLPLFGSRDFAEGVKAFIERRQPVFEGR